MSSSATRGCFFVLDGIDGCGKSTQARRLTEALGRDRGEPGLPPLHLREPGSTQLGEGLRELLLRGEAPLDAGSELLLFAAARRAMLAELVEPALAAGRDVVCERFHPSTFAYQAVAGGLDEERVLALLRSWAGEPAPDLVLLMELGPREAARRCSERGGSDRFEGRGAAFHAAVARGYRRYAELDPRARIVDAEGTVDEVAQRVLEEVRRHAS